MDNITANARQLLARQQQPYLSMPTNPMPVIPNSVKDRVRTLYANAPEEFQRFLELSEDFILMGSHMMAAAYIHKCNAYMEQAKGAVVQNMSVAGSIAGYDSGSNVVEPWMERNRTFLNRTCAPSQIGSSSSISTFERPRPLTARRYLQPIQENFPPPSHPAPRARQPRQVIPSSSDEEGFRRGRLIRSTPLPPNVRRPRGGSPTVKRNDYNDEDEMVEENVSPVQVRRNDGSTFRKPFPPSVSRAIPPTSTRPIPSVSRVIPSTSTRPIQSVSRVIPSTSTRPIPSVSRAPTSSETEEEDDLLTRNSPSTRSNSKKRTESAEAVISRPVGARKKRPVPAPAQDPLNTTVTRRGRVVRPPKKFNTGQNNSIIDERPVTNEENAVPIRATGANHSKRPKTSQDTTRVKRRRLLPTVEDDLRISARQVMVDQSQSSTSRDAQSSTSRDAQSSTSRDAQPSTSRDTQPSTLRDTQPSTSRDTSRAMKKPAAAVYKTSVSKRAPSSQRKQPAKPTTPALLPPPSPIAAKKAQPKVPSIKKSSGGTPQIDFDVSQRSFRSVEESDTESN